MVSLITPTSISCQAEQDIINDNLISGIVKELKRWTFHELTSKLSEQSPLTQECMSQCEEDEDNDTIWYKGYAE